MRKKFNHCKQYCKLQYYHGEHGMTFYVLEATKMIQLPSTEIRICALILYHVSDRQSLTKVISVELLIIPRRVIVKKGAIYFCCSWISDNHGHSSELCKRSYATLWRKRLYCWLHQTKNIQIVIVCDGFLTYTEAYKVHFDTIIHFQSISQCNRTTPEFVVPTLVYWSQFNGHNSL
jgi:hypothetical protein